MSARAALGIDAGGTSTRWRLVDGSGGVLGQGRLGPLSGLVFDAAGRTAATSSVEELARAAAGALRTSGASPLAVVVAGVTGLSAGGEPARWLAAELARGLVRALGAGAAPAAGEVRVLGDMDVAYGAAFAPGEGVLVYGGTGAIAYHVTAAGETLRAGGHGYLLDDEGGGFSVGRAALRSVLREADRLGRPPRGALAEALYTAIGGRDWEVVRAHVYGGGRSRVAALAPAVAAAAEAGDETARTVLRWAGAELARLANVLLARLRADLPVALAGGVLHLGSELTGAFAAALPAGTKPRWVAGEPVDAAAELARAALRPG